MEPSINPGLATGTQQPNVLGQQQSTAGMPAINGINQMNRPWAAIFSIAAVFITLIALFIIYFFNVQSTSKIKNYESETTALNTKLAEPSVVAAESEIKGFAASLIGYEAAVASQLDYSILMTEMSQRMPKDVLLDSVVYDEKGSVRLSGTAGNFVSVAQAFLSLKKSDLLRNVALINVAIADKDNARRTTYTITANVNKAAMARADKPVNDPSGESTETTEGEGQE